MCDLTMRIDTRNYRIYIHKPSLEAIGNPDFVRLGFYAQTNCLMLLGTWTDEKKAIRVTYNTTGTFTVFSKPLIQGIQKVSGCLGEPATYLLRGRKKPSMPAIIYPVDIKPMPEGQGGYKKDAGTADEG